MCCIAMFIVKYVLFFANLLFTLAGIAFIAVGVAIKLQLGDVLDVIPDGVNTVPVLVIVAGSIIFVISFFGCCGAIKENCCMLSTYAIFVAALAGLKIWLTVVIFRNLNKLNDLVFEWIATAFQESNQGQFGLVEEALQCCGVTGAGSYQSSALPSTCCAESVCTTSNAYSGCVGALTDYLNAYGNGVGVTIIIIIAVEVAAVFFAILLGATSSAKNRQGNYA